MLVHCDGQTWFLQLQYLFLMHRFLVNLHSPLPRAGKDLSSGVDTFLSPFPYQDLNSETGLSHTPACHLTAQPSANQQHQQRARIREPWGMEMNKPPQAPKGNSLFGFVLCGARMKKGRILAYSRSYQWLLKDLWHNTERMQSN